MLLSNPHRPAATFRFLAFRSLLLLSVLSLFVGLFATAAKAQDKTDHPLLSRIAGTVLTDKKVQQFGVAKASPAGSGHADLSYEGKITTLDYATVDGPAPGEVKIYRNYLAAVQKMGGHQINTGFDANDAGSLVTGAHVFALSAAKQPPVAILNITNAFNYTLTMVEPEAMEQSVQAGQLASDIKTKGFATLHINFDTGKSELKSDGKGAVDEVAKLLKADPALRLSIEGHTDNVGSAASNLKLSESRAHAVVDGLVAQGIDAKRLAYKGLGASKPVADNATEAGKAENRRVELVKVK